MTLECSKALKRIWIPYFNGTIAASGNYFVVVKLYTINTIAVTHQGMRRYLADSPTLFELMFLSENIVPVDLAAR